MFIITVLIICAIACAAIASRREKNPAVWFLAGLLFGPIGLLFVIVDRSGGQKCPECAETIKKQAALCKHCGHRLG